MTSAAPLRRTALRVLHPCLAGVPGAVPFPQAGLTDRQRIAVLLQAAGLLSLLEAAGWRLTAGWAPALAAPGGLLVLGGEGAAPGTSAQIPQELLRDLAARLFGTDREPAGRGEGRRAARGVLQRWRPTLVPLPPDEAAAQLLEAAPFLWEPAFGPARAALAGELLREAGARLWVAGPRPFRQRLLARCREAAELRALLAGPEARDLWNPAEKGEARELALRGKWGAAVAAWERRPPSSAGERVVRAGALFALGRFEAALESLAGLGSPEARRLALRCQLQLGALGAARAVLVQLEKERLEPEDTVELAEIAARVFANRREGSERVWPWVRRALAETSRTGGRLAVRARLVAAEAAWDRRDLAAMDLWLEKARPALDDPELAWRWHHVRGLRAVDDPGGGPEAARSFARALRAGRRLLPRHQAAGLWNDLGLGRARAGDLAGAERAFLHALRLFSGCDGPRRETLLLPNLAEIRLRRGRLAGVREILERSAAENRLAGNVRGLSEDAGLLARYELALGRPEAALALCREALVELDRQGRDWHRAELHLFAARALGWLGRPDEAAAELARSSPEAWKDLEPEERPALLAQAGDRAGAVAEAEGTPFAPLWAGLLAGGAPPEAAWEALGSLEPYRAARLVLDLEIVASCAAPPWWRRQAAAVFRRMGAPLLAERLEAREDGAWRALAAYLGREPGDPEALAALFAGAGYPEAELARVGPDGGRRVLVAGPGGAGELSIPLAGGALVLRARRTDAVLEALLALSARDQREAEEEPVRPDGPERQPDGTVGESPVLRAALERIDRLAPGDLPVLILGESGTGKELAARRLHRASPRAAAPFVAVNCAALSETLLLSDLFGHVRGAFTGADRERKGVFETAHGGTVFLDEIGDLPLVAQGMLLRVLQEGEVRRLGESATRRVDVRVVAATHRDLARMVAGGTFRQDLYYRLKVGTVELPPLRDRGGDVSLLADHFLARRSGRGVRLSRQARARLLAHSWPGNVRELQNVLAAAAALATGGVIDPEHLDLPRIESPPAGSYHEQVDAFRRRLIEQALAACEGRQAEAARLLGISRQALSQFIRG
jgi:two-component system NtrC family response regulator